MELIGVHVPIQDFFDLIVGTRFVPHFIRLFLSDHKTVRVAFSLWGSARAG